MLKDLTKYIENKKWHLQKNGDKFLFYKPPPELGLDDKYLLPIPKDSEKSDFESTLNDTINFIAKLYDVNKEEISSSLTDYFQILKRNAMYFRLISENTMFQKTLEVNDIWSFLKNLSTSYTNYVKIEFTKNFSTRFTDTKIVNKTLNKLLELSRLRVVSLRYASFGIGVSSDSFMGKGDIEIKDINDWREQIVNNFKDDVININFNSSEQVDSVLKKFNDEERKKIYDPLFNSINNNSDYRISITDSEFTPKRTLNRIPDQTIGILIPKREKIELLPQRRIKFIEKILVVDESSSRSINLKTSDLEENLFTKKRDKLETLISSINYHGNKLEFNTQITFITEPSKNGNFFEVYVDNLNISFTISNIEDLEKEIEFELTKIFDAFYEGILGLEKTKLLNSILENN